MGYKTDGSSHRNGIKNEDVLKSALEQNPNMFGHEEVYGSLIEVMKKGGPKHKDDLTMTFPDNISCGISAKRWSGVTHDWCNDSKTINELSNKYSDYNRIIQDGLEIVPSREKEKQRARVNEAGLRQLQFFNENPEDLKSFIKTQFEKIRGQEIILNDVKNEQWVYYKAKDHPIFDKIDDPNWAPSLNISPTEKNPFPTSANIEGTNLRLRAVTNNGIGALLGLSESNKSSQFVLKVQQDNVKTLIATLEEQGKLKRVSY